MLGRKHISCVLSRAEASPSNLPPALCSALRSLRKRDVILILPADKGRATVIMDKTNYERKKFEMLSIKKT